MTKEIYISSTPHETRLAVVEDDQLAEIYYERENEYTLAGSIYKGKVTRVLPGMQSAFVDIGLERDAFLYVTDFAEEQEDGEEYVPLAPGQSRGHGRAAGSHSNDARGAAEGDSHASGEEPAARSFIDRKPAGQPVREASTAPGSSSGDEEGAGGRRWRGRRGRRRGRGGSSAQERPSANGQGGFAETRRTEITESTQFETEAIPAEADFEHAHQDFAVQAVASERFPAPQLEHPRSEQPRSEQLPMVLPGESLSKYRRGESAPAAQATGAVPAEREASAATPKPTFQPSTMVVGPLAWDGSEVLPGESLSRHKRTRGASSAVESFSSPAAEVGPVVEETAAAPAENGVPADVATSLPVAEFEEPSLVQHDTTLEEPSLVQHVTTVEEPSLVRHDRSIEEAQEFEPAEASVSYRFDPASPSAYRQSGVVEPPAAEPPMEAESAPTQDSMEYEAVAEQTEEADSELEPFFGEAASIVEPAPPQEAGFQAQEATSPATEELTPVHPAEVTSSATEETSTEQEESAQDDADSDHDEHVFDPGHGNLEEETIDEEEPEGYAAQSLQDEAEYDDLIEETLDMQMDSGLLSELVRDQHIEQRTRFVEENGNGESAALGTEEDTFEEESFGAELGEIELEDATSPAEEDSESDEPANADAARNRASGGRNGRRENRGQRHGGDRRMRRGTAQTTNLPAITELLKPNQEILVQIAKEPIARKGARITSHIALPGRFLVFMPTVNHVGVSRKIASDEERQRLKHILLSEKGAASGGFIVRTAAAAASEEDLRADIRFLLTLWAEIRQRTENAKPPALIYHDLSLVERVLRDQVTDNFSSIWVDTEADYERVLRFLNRFEPALVRRVKLYTKETPLFEQFGIQEEINNALRSKVWLKSGGSIVINQTEALVAIDINTGKYVGKTARLEDTILKTNLDAIPEIVRQIRLRDLGGIIVIDFIDMDERKNRNKVMLALEDALKSDRAPSKVLQFNDFGLVAITRKRVKQSLERTLSVPCSVCMGTGMVKGPLTVCNEIYVELRKMYRQIDRGDVMLRVNPEVVKQLKASNGRWLSEMEEMSGKTVIVKSDASLHPEQFDIQ
ncbi:MAG: Rne/Rng family ribonuclease [Terriglobia bacterium]|nr:Rne/Rng family ribonuclease [Terriglobia bacterium]